MKNLEITYNDQQQTLIKYLNKYLAKAPNSLLYKWIRTKKIKVNKKRAEASQMLYLNDVVNIYIYDEELEKWMEEKKEFKSRIDVDIAFENEHVLIMDKAQNVLVHASGPEDYGKNLVDFMVDLLISRGEYNPRLEQTFRPALVNRIDRNTMGLVIGAKTRKALLHLNEDQEKIKKYYLALVEGEISESFTIKNKLLKDEDNMVYVSDDGKESVTRIKPVHSTKDFSLVEVELLTGRTHQIRASLANVGHPIIGDRRYGKKRNWKYIKDQQLVAYKLKFDEDIRIKSLRGLEVTSKYEKYILNLYNKMIGDFNE